MNSSGSVAGALQIIYQRPGPGAYEWLRATLAALKAQDPFSPVTVVVPNLPAGRAVRRSLARPAPGGSSGGFVNVRTLRIADVASLVLGPDAHALPELDGVLELAAVRAAVRQSVAARQESGGPSALAPVAEQLALHRALARLYRELRRQEPDIDSLLGASSAPGSTTDVTDASDATAPVDAPNANATDDEGAGIRRAALQTFRAYQDLTRGYADQTDLRQQAAARLRDPDRPAPPALREIGTLVLFLPPRLDPADAALFAALARRGNDVIAALSWLGDPVHLGDEPARRAAHLLAVAFDGAAPAPPAPPAALELHADVAIVRAPDAAEEVRETLRRISADLGLAAETDGSTAGSHAGPSVPLHQVAILYRDMGTYGPLVREALDLAEFPWVSLHGRSLLESRPGRALLTLLRLPERAFARPAVLEWLDAIPSPPVVASAGGESPQTLVPPGTWDRISRAARVVRGTEQWRTRLEAFIKEEEDLSRRRRREDLPAAQQRVQAARQMQAVIAALHRDLRPPPAGSSWSEFVTWADGLRVRYAGAAPADSATGDTAWPKGERPFADDVRDALAGLARADSLTEAPYGSNHEAASPAGTTLHEFLETLEGVLELRTRAQGTLGEGIVAGPVQAVGGLTFRRVYLLGMAEGVFPPTPSPDPFFPDAPTHHSAPAATAGAMGVPAWTDRRTLQRIGDRTAFLTALAAADGGAVTLTVPEAHGGRAAFPSRWVLEVAAALASPEDSGDGAGRRRPLYTAAFRALREDPETSPWLRVIPSAQNGARRSAAPADLEDRRLAEAARWTDPRLGGRPLAEHPLALRADLALGRALAVAAARESAAFTAFDGNVARLAATAHKVRDLLAGARPVSATRIETWATCPYRYFLQYVLGVQPTDRPEESWTIDARDRGSIVHNVLEDLLKELTQADRLRGGEAYTDADRARLREIAEQHFTEAAQAGKTGHPLVWETGRRGLLRDLEGFLTADEQCRQETGLAPTFFEQEFGTGAPGAPGAWPEVAIPVALGDAGEAGQLRFQGLIDRVDVDAARTTALVYDYKTGSADGYKALQEDPVLGGTHIQLALYARAARAYLERCATETGAAPASPDELTAGGAFWFVTEKAKHERRGIPAGSPKVAQRLEETLNVVGEGIRAGAFPQVPGEEGFGGWEHCRFCDFDRICPTNRDDAWERKGRASGAAIYLRLQPASPDDGPAE